MRRTERSLAKLEKRPSTSGVYCWGYGLDHEGVDISGHDLENWAGLGKSECSGPYQTVTFGTAINSALVYACIDKVGWCEMFSANDVREALGQMDKACPAYEAGYYMFPGTFDAKIIGKCHGGDNICV
jgi:hypothetical protein